MSFFHGKQLLKKDGSLVDAEAELEGKVILVYFSAHWCPPCRGFTPKLKDCFEKLEGKPVAIVFVSADETEEEMESYYKNHHGNWFCAPFESDLATQLHEKCDVEGIPTLAVVDKQGNMLHDDATDDVQCLTSEEAFEKWQKLSK